MMTTRKPRDTSYSMTQRLIARFGVECLKKQWQNAGMYGAAVYFSEKMGETVTPYVMRYLSHKFDWKRTVDEYLPIVQGIRKGTRPASYYRHIIVPGMDNSKQRKVQRETV